jgi:hypothetical protein
MVLQLLLLVVLLQLAAVGKNISNNQGQGAAASRHGL